MSSAQGSATQDQICVLNCKKPIRLTKVIKDGKITPEQHAQQYRWQLFYARDIHELSKLLTDLAAHPRQCIIRGHPINPLAADDWIARTKNGKSPTFREQKRHYLCADLDSLFLPKEYDIVKDPRRCAEYALEQLCVVEPAFEGVTVHVQISGSAGIKQGFRGHLWFWLTTPLSSEELTRWAKAINDSVGFIFIDPSPFRTVQEHYTADPIYEGSEDPLKDRRSFLIQGERDEAEIIPPAIVIKPRPFPTGEKKEQGDLDFWLSRIGDHDGGNGFHNAILAACCAYVRGGGDKR
jgi:hypothetical protein